MTILRVALDVPLARLFDYLDTQSGIQVGQRVLVTFGRRPMVGIVIAIVTDSDMPLEKLKTITRAFTDEAPLPADTLRLLRFCSDYYQYPVGQTLLGVLPPRLREGEPAALPLRTAYRLTPAGLAAGIEAIPKRASLQRRIFEVLGQAARLVTPGNEWAWLEAVRDDEPLVLDLAPLRDSDALPDLPR